MADNQDNNGGYVSYLKDLLSKAGQNMSDVDKMQKSQTELASKRLRDPNYQPSKDEAENENQYYKSVTGAVAGSVAPVSGVAGMAANIAPKVIPIMESEVPKFAAKYTPLVEGQGMGLVQKFQKLLGKGEMNTADMTSAAQQLQDAALQRGVKSPVTPELMQALRERGSREVSEQMRTGAATQAASQEAVDELRKQALNKILLGK